MLHRSRPFALIALAALAAAAAAADETPKAPADFPGLKFRLLGPFVGGRTTRVQGLAGDPFTYYASTASGGVWKSTDGGQQWKPIFDDMEISSIGSIAVAPSDPTVIYVGSGEANIRGNVAAGNGIYKSTDAGKTWTHVWKQEGQIGTMVVHPKNADIAYAAVLGHAFGPNPERGVYRTVDGGKTWLQVLKKDADTGASDVCIDPNNPRILFAGLWQARRKPWDLVSGGPGSGFYSSRDGGDTWKELGKDAGMPEGIKGKIGCAIAPSDGQRVYALIEAENGGLYRSDDGGEHFSLANAHRSLRQRAWYYTTLTIDPRNADIVWFPQVPLLRTIDGGRTLQGVRAPHGDFHDAWIDPLNSNRVIVAHDGGVGITTDFGKTWLNPPLPLGQLYHVGVDNAVPYHVHGAMQDIGTAWGPSQLPQERRHRNGEWSALRRRRRGRPHRSTPDNPNIVYAGEYLGYFTRYDHRPARLETCRPLPRTGRATAAATSSTASSGPRPSHSRPTIRTSIYHGGEVIFRSSDGGQTWTIISADLTRNDKTKQQWAGGPITGDNTGVENYGTIFAIAESPLRKGVDLGGRTTVSCTSPRTAESRGPT